MNLLKTAVASLLVMGTLAMAVPSSARAEDWHHDRNEQHWGFDHWRNQGHNWDHDRDNWNWRGNPGANDWHRNHSYAYGNGYYGNGYGNGNGYRGNGYGYGNGYYGNGYGLGNGYGYGNGYANGYGLGNGYFNPLGHQNLPPNGEGMINKRNPNLFWACDSNGNHCHWQPRR